MNWTDPFFWAAKKISVGGGAPGAWRHVQHHKNIKIKMPPGLLGGSPLPKANRVCRCNAPWMEGSLEFLALPEALSGVLTGKYACKQAGTALSWWLSPSVAIRQGQFCCLRTGLLGHAWSCPPSGFLPWFLVPPPAVIWVGVGRQLEEGNVMLWGGAVAAAQRGLHKKWLAEGKFRWAHCRKVRGCFHHYLSPPTALELNSLDLSHHSIPCTRDNQ